MAFGGAWGRGIGGLRGQFQQPRQMQQRNQRFQPMQQAGVQLSAQQPQLQPLPYGQPRPQQQQMQLGQQGPPPGLYNPQLAARQRADAARMLHLAPDRMVETASPADTAYLRERVEAIQPNVFRPPRGPGFAKPLSPPPSAPDQAGGGAGGPPTSWKMSIEPMAHGGMIPGYQNGGGVDPDDEKIAMMELMLREIAKGDSRFASRSPFGENPEESEWYRENILPEEKRTFGGQVVPLDSINYAVSNNPLRAATSLSDLGAKNAELALLHDWAKNPENVVLPGQRSGAGSRLFGKEIMWQNPDDPRPGIRRSITPYSRYATELQARADEGRAYGGIIGLQGGGYIPMYAGGGIPGYSIGGFFRGLGKVLSKVVPTAMNFIPGLSSLSGVAKAGIGALSQGIGDISSGRDLNLDRMLGGAGRTYATSSAINRIRDIEGLKDEGLWGGLGKVLTDEDVSRQAMAALADIPFGEAQALAVTEAAAKRGAEQQAAEAGDYTGVVNPMGTAGRIMPTLVSADPVGGIAERMTYGQQPIDYSRSDGGIVPGYRKGGRTKRRGRGGRGQSRRRIAPAVREPIMPPPQYDDNGEDEEQDWFAPPPIVPAVQPVAQQLQQSGLVPLTPMIPAVRTPPPVVPDWRAMEENEDFVEPEYPVVPPVVPPVVQLPVTPQTAAVTPPIPTPAPVPVPLAADQQEIIEEEEFVPEPQPVLPQIQQQIPQTAAALPVKAKKRKKVKKPPIKKKPPKPAPVDWRDEEEEDMEDVRPVVPEVITPAPPPILPQIQEQIPQTAVALPVPPMITPQTSVPEESRDWGEEPVATPYPVDRRQIPDDIEDLVPETTRSLRRKEAVATPTDTQRAAFEAEQRRYAEEGADVAPPSAAPPVESPSMADRQREMATREQAAMSATTGEFDPADLSGELPATMAGYVPPARLPEDWRDEELEEEGAESDAAYQKTIDSLERRREIRLADASEEEKEALKLPEDLGPGVVGIGEAPVDWERLAKDPDYDPYAKPHTPTDEERAAVEKEKERHAQSTTSAGSITPTTRSGTGVGSGFYGEQKWFDPNAPDPAKRDIGGFSPHELPRTSADFAVAGDAGGADLLSRLNAPAAPVQNYLSPAPVPGAAEGGLVDIGQVPMDRLERLAKAAQQIESPGSQQIIEQAIEDFGVEMVNQIITMIQQQGPMTAPDGSVPEYGIGGFLKKLGKAVTLGGTQLLPKRIRDPINRGVLKAAPVAANFIPGVGPIAAAGIGAVAKGIEGRMDAADRDREAAAVPQDQLIDAPQLEEDPLTALPSPQPQRYMPNPAAWQAPAQQEVAGQMTYGHEDWARGGLINGGGGDAMADDILVNAEMGMNGERQPIAVSAGEYIVPGDVLAHLGSGNTEEGGEVMDQFVEDVRVQRTGSPEQPAPIDLRDVLPGTYGERYG